MSMHSHVSPCMGTHVPMPPEPPVGPLPALPPVWPRPPFPLPEPPPVALPPLPAPPPWLVPDAPPVDAPPVAEPPDEAPELPPVPELDPAEPLAPLLPPVSPPPPVFESPSSPQAVAKHRSEIAVATAPFVGENEKWRDLLLLMASLLLGGVRASSALEVSERGAPARLRYFPRLRERARCSGSERNRSRPRCRSR